MAELKAVRKYAAQHDLFNRLHSIAADERFVQTVAGEWYEGRFDVVANQRCGNWYCNPSTSSKAYAYFKSTDGHMSQWDFNLRRSNLALASHAEQRGGLILVDSTRRGKRMPDALSKTVPIWCAVINLAIAMRYNRSEEWDTTLYLPPQIVPSTERSQIEARLSGWAESLERSSLPLPDLSKPLRPFFVHPSTSVPPHIPQSPGFTPIICLSASRWVNNRADDIPSVTRLGAKRTVGFEYVPGGGDDDELWARGLNPGLFHANETTLLSAERDDLPRIVDDIVQAGPERSQPLATRSHLVGVPSSSSRLALDIGPTVCSSPTWEHDNEQVVIVDVVEVEKYPKNTSFIHSTRTGAMMALPSPKSDGKAYASALGQLVNWVRSKSSNGIIIRKGRVNDLKALSLSSEDVTALNDLSVEHPSLPTADTRKLVLPLALVLLCALPEIADLPNNQGAMTKEYIASKLHSLVALWPDGNPPRAALKRVNEFLMGEGRRL